MSNIIENFNQNQLDLIIDNEGANYTFSPLNGDYIRMTVFSADNIVAYQFYSNKDLQGKYIDVSDENTEPQIKLHNTEHSLT